MKKGIVIFFFLCIIVVCGVMLKNSIYITDTDEDIENETENTITNENVNNSVLPVSTANVVNNKDEKKLNLYTIDYDTMECVPNIVTISSDFEINAREIVNKVIEDFLESPTIIKIEESGDSVIVYFDNEKAPVVGMSDEMESAMLDSIAYSLVDNLKTCVSVYFRTNAGSYRSENLSLEYDEPYLTSELEKQ